MTPQLVLTRETRVSTIVAPWDVAWQPSEILTMLRCAVTGEVCPSLCGEAALATWAHESFMLVKMGSLVGPTSLGSSVARWGRPLAMWNSTREPGDVANGVGTNLQTANAKTLNCGPTELRTRVGNGQIQLGILGGLTGFGLQ